MTDPNNTRRNEFDHHRFDEFVDVETNADWSPEQIRSLKFLLVDIAIIVAIIAVGLLLG